MDGETEWEPGEGRRLHLLLCRLRNARFRSIQKQVNVTTKLTSLDNVGTKYQRVVNRDLANYEANVAWLNSSSGDLNLEMPPWILKNQDGLKYCRNNH